MTADESCGCPLTKDLLQTEKGQYCRTRKRKCNKHTGWERIRRASIDMERLRQVGKTVKGTKTFLMGFVYQMNKGLYLQGCVILFTLPHLKLLKLTIYVT